MANSVREAKWTDFRHSVRFSGRAL